MAYCCDTPKERPEGPVLRWLRRLAARRLGGGPAGPPPPGPLLLEACLRLGFQPGGADSLEPRLELLVGQLSAELSGCGWCIEGGRHRARRAGLPPEAVAAVRAPAGTPWFSEREEAALVLAAAVVEGAAADALVAGPVLAAARRHFSEREIVRLTVLAAGEHFGDRLAARAGPAAPPSPPTALRGLS